jgi:TRAP-type mannitol/chloroaromatic compound transport system substrate-binding protein
MTQRAFLLATVVGTAAVLHAPAAHAVDIAYRSFSDSATMGPQAEAFASKLAALSGVTLGSAAAVRFQRLPGIPAVPARFGGDLVAAVAAGAAGGGFDAAYISGSDLNKTWGFLYNSGVPFGPRFDEFLGFLYGRVGGGGQTGLEIMQAVLDQRRRGVVALPIVASSEQLSGYFPLPIGDNDAHERGIGLAGLCQQAWTLRYLPPAQDVLDKACDLLVAYHEIRVKRLRFVQAIPGGGSLVEAVKNGQLQGFEYATPADDLSTLFNTPDNPGTVGVRFVHTPGWQQPFLITWMIVNRDRWNGLTTPQRALMTSVARDHALASWGDSMQKQGDALRAILEANRGDGRRGNELVESEWPECDQERLIYATNLYLDERTFDPALPAVDRADYAIMLETLRRYVHANNHYWVKRAVRSSLRFHDWVSPSGEPWIDESRDDHDHDHGHGHGHHGW